MRALNFLLIFGVVCCFTAPARAQVDCLYTFNVSVFNKEGKSIEKAEVRIYTENEGKKGYTYRPNMFENGAHKIFILTWCGMSRRPFLLTVSAPGFITQEQRIMYDKSVERVNVTLFTVDDIVPKMRLTGTVMDTNGALILTAS